MPSVTALLGPTNTGKTYHAMERLLSHPTRMIGFPLRLLARENYGRLVQARGAALDEDEVAALRELGSEVWAAALDTSKSAAVRVAAAKPNRIKPSRQTTVTWRPHEEFPHANAHCRSPERGQRTVDTREGRLRGC